MLYTQFRENERTARFEVRLVPGNRCQLGDAGREENPTAKSRSSESAPRAKKVAAETWSLGARDEATWVDLEAELRRIRHRAPIDFGLRTGEEAGAGRELILRLDKLLLDLYRNESEDYLTYLGLLNIFEYFRLVHNLKHFDRETTGAKQLGLVSDDFFACRRIALERDLAELTEWLVAHGVGIPDLSIFYPEEYASEATADDVPKKKGRKKAGAEADAEGTGEPLGMPIVVKHLAELVRLQQANTADLVHFVDDVMHRMQLSTPREALEKMQELLPWIDLDYLERQYNSLKVEQARETERQQMAILRQREIFEKRPRRGTKGGHPIPTLRDRPNRETLLGNSDAFGNVEAFGNEGDDDSEPSGDANERQPMTTGDAADAVSNIEPQMRGEDHDELEDEEGQAEIFGHESAGGGGGFHDDRHRMNDHSGGQRGRRKRRNPRRGGMNDHPGPRDGRPTGRPAGGPPPQARQQGPPPPRRERPHRVGGQPNFDEIQPFSNYSPGLTPPPNSSAAVLAGGAAGKKKWRRRK